ncbi:CLUMA_CG000343, isoform A [Clunio marinus]|uniref:CLUMA_CG000343, isoform A n=1 Tax=Clunio marinus TaxID=568069 RepID=A0A1J1HES1_9DIPT|nr:CLUMA_CG000343, isoform A [Clunio marinus]
MRNSISENPSDKKKSPDNIKGTNQCFWCHGSATTTITRLIAATNDEEDQDTRQWGRAKARKKRRRFASALDIVAKLKHQSVQITKLKKK